MTRHAVSIKRAYDPPAPGDGQRVLVDRLWPRGLAKAKAHIDLWLKEVAPSTALREWFAHDPAKWEEFQRRYRHELEHNAAFDELRALTRAHRVTLIYGAKDTEHNQAQVLRQLLDHGREPSDAS